MIVWGRVRRSITSLKASIVSAGAVSALNTVWTTQCGQCRSEALYSLDKLGFNDDGSKKFITKNALHPQA